MGECLTMDIEGAFIAETARGLVLSERPGAAYRILADGTDSADAIVGILDGSLTLDGWASSGISVTPTDDGDEAIARYRKDLRYIYAGRWLSPHGWCRPVRTIEIFGPDAGLWATRQMGNFPGKRSTPLFMRWCQLRADYYCMHHEQAHLVELGGSAGHVFVIFEPCSEPPQWLPHEVRTPQQAVDDALDAGRCLDKGGAPILSIRPSAAAEQMVRDAQLEDDDADDVREAAYDAEDEMKASREAWIGEEVRRRAGADTFEITLSTGRSLTVPRAPFLVWALSRTDSADKALPWEPVSTPGMKLQMDNPAHTDWLLGAGVSLDDAYAVTGDKAVTQAVIDAQLAAMGDEEERPRFGGIMAALGQFRDGHADAAVIVDAGRVEGVVGWSVVVLPSLAGEHAPELDGVSGVIAEAGGPLSHTAILAKDARITVMLVPDAMARYSEGDLVVLEPAACAVTVDPS